jgi:CxxC motif-containing protein (DUF1111 family)
MSAIVARTALAAGIGLALACATGPRRALDDPRLGGRETVFVPPGVDAFSFPTPGLDASERRAFAVGNAFFRDNWVPAPAGPEGRDGLGPLHVSRSCSACHAADGRGRPPERGEDPGDTGMLVRLADDPVYGAQLQTAAIAGARPEGRLSIAYELVSGRFGDGEPYTLASPRYGLLDPAYGPLEAAERIAPRVAPQLVGLGLLERVSEAEILAAADPDDADGDGISGRPNRVLDRRTGAVRLGRFGWKANQPSIEQQAAAALSGDLGLTTSLFPVENPTAPQRSGLQLISGGEPEVDDLKLDRLRSYVAALAVPARRDADGREVRRGGRLFERLGCPTCHRPALRLEPEEAGIIRPYTDLLLHDMGPDLADGLPDGEAGGTEWRTPPLWGIGLVPAVNGHERYLHDGRARGLAESILWHGGEAQRSRERFRALDAGERASLLAFLRSL